MEKNKKLWAISLIVISVCNLITSLINIFEVELPDFVFIIFIVVTFAAVAALFYTSIKLWFCNMDNKK